MIEISIRYLGGLSIEKGIPERRILLPEGSKLADLKKALASLDLNLQDNELVFLLDGQGLAHYPDDYPLSSKEVVAIFPMISGG